MTAPWNDVLVALRALHLSEPITRAFCGFPATLTDTPCPPCDHPARPAFANTNFGPTPYAATVQVLQQVAPYAHWRDTYKHTDIGQDFLDRFGCFCLIGPKAPWTSPAMHGFLVFMPPDLWYPWHHHPAEELYFVLAGHGLFHRAGQPPDQRTAGEAMFHAPNQPHALQTTDQPLLAYVLWRDNFDTPPRLTPLDQLNDAVTDPGPI